MNKLVFCHGLFYKNNFFSGLITSLEEEFKKRDFKLEIINLDLGYFSDKTIDQNSNFDGAIAIGHGIGFNKLLDINTNWKGILGISTLLQFLVDNISKRKIDNLERAFNYNKELAITSFINRITNNKIIYALPYSKVNWDLIKEDINYLKNINSISKLKEKNIPSLFLHGESDIWYDVSDAKKQFKNFNLEIKEGTSHMLGYLDILWCKNHILKFIDSI